VTKLSVNVNKFALLRNSRDTDYPNLVQMARRALAARAHGITVHPRPDERHIRYSDVHELSSVLASCPDAEFNIEGNPTPEFLKLVLAVRPDQCTLVPDDPHQLTSDHGWNLEADGERLISVVGDLREAGIRVSLFMDPEIDQIERVPSTRAERIELYTEPYARAFGTEAEDEVWARFARAAAHARELGLGVNAGHDLNLVNLPRFLTIPSVLEVSIGHAIVVESFDFGFEGTLGRYLEILGTVVG
jgi:pyridoxine 5-phosphate synthase